MTFPLVGFAPRLPSLLRQLRAAPAASAAASVAAADTFERATPAQPRPENPAFVSAHRLADSTACMPVVFGSTRTLELLSQISESGPSDAYDPFECGAASLTAGLVMLGRDRLRAAVPLMLRRLNNAVQQVLALPESVDRTLALRELARARTSLDRGVSTTVWTMSDLRAFMRATYRVLAVQQWSAPMSQGKTQPLTFTAGLLDPVLVSARNELWGQADIEHNGRQYTLYALSYQKDGGHAVLAERVPSTAAEAPLLFDPLPELDGTALTAEDTPSRPIRRVTEDERVDGGGRPMDEIR